MSAQRVLSVQSHVVHGYVGNKCAVYALQTLGIEVDPINSVHFSNHTGYKTWRGEKLSGDKIWQLFEGLLENQLTQYSHVLTGYLNSPSTLQEIIKMVKILKEKNPALQFYCDPVMGDDGKLYVTAEMVALYREAALPCADVIFPNQTEAEYLSGVPIVTEADALRAAEQLRALGPRTVIITTAPSDSTTRDGTSDSSDSTTRDTITTLLVTDQGRWRLTLPKCVGEYTGTGDLFAALVLGARSRGDPWHVAVHRAGSAVGAVLARTRSNGELALISDPPLITTAPLIGQLTQL